VTALSRRPTRSIVACLTASALWLTSSTAAAQSASKRRCSISPKLRLCCAYPQRSFGDSLSRTASLPAGLGTFGASDTALCSNG
jgi:hypothetical protein